MVRARGSLIAWVLCVLGACASEGLDATSDPMREREPLLEGEAQQELLCGRGRSDVVLDVFCSGEPHAIKSFASLKRAFGFGRGEDVMQEGFAFTSHSTSLVAKTVSAINPRAIFIQPASDGGELVLLSFTRGDQFAETIVRDRATAELRFYVTTFKQDCNDEPEGCTPGDLLTEAVESGWQDLNVYAEDDLANTPLDCLACHQPDGPGTPRFLRMQEIEPPWNHWFFGIVSGGLAVTDDYFAAKGDEAYVGIGGEEILRSNPGLLSSTLFFEDSGEQPNAFVSSQIEREVKESAAEHGGNQPTDNSVPGESETWNKIYERAKRGEAIAVPYHDVKITDPDKLAAMTAAYTDYREGRIDRDELPDIRDVYPDDPERLAKMGFATEPGLDGEGVLLQACAQCHNSKLDQSLSRARFNVDLSRLDRSAKDAAIARLSLPPDALGAMPPPRIRSLSEQARERLIELLRR